MTLTRTLAALSITSACVLAACASPAPGPPSPAPASSPTPGSAAPESSAPPEVSGGATGSAYPDALRAAGLPVSETGASEALIGSGICSQVRAGRSDEAIAGDLTAITWTLAQARTAVRLAHAVLHC